MAENNRDAIVFSSIENFEAFSFCAVKRACEIEFQQVTRAAGSIEFAEERQQKQSRIRFSTYGARRLNGGKSRTESIWKEGDSQFSIDGNVFTGTTRRSKK